MRDIARDAPPRAGHLLQAHSAQPHDGPQPHAACAVAQRQVGVQLHGLQGHCSVIDELLGSVGGGCAIRARSHWRLNVAADIMPPAAERPSPMREARSSPSSVAVGS
ncbi:hypothetical protein QH494_09590 [Sphingomonas sp. AR_OL41]|jgi:hypothetical protein|nr:hypothetical protein [Sphingomonas sp. AR_OL41]